VSASPAVTGQTPASIDDLSFPPHYWFNLYPHPTPLWMPKSFLIPCINCQDASTECILISHSKSSCSRCSSNDLKCVFPPSVRNMPHDKDHVQFSRNCVFCTQSHCQCRFAGPHSSKCSRCIEYRVPCFLTLSGEFHSYSYTIAPLCMCPHILSVLYYYY
jgi:hypothetical protein